MVYHFPTGERHNKSVKLNVTSLLWAAHVKTRLSVTLRAYKPMEDTYPRDIFSIDY